MIPELRHEFERSYSPAAYGRLLARLDERCGAPVEFRVAETPIFVERSLLDQMAQAGADLAGELLSDAEYLVEARRAIPEGFRMAGETSRPHFLTADFALVAESDGTFAPRLVEIQAFPSVYGYQAVLSEAYRDVYGLDRKLGTFLSGLDERGYWELVGRTILGGHDPENVVLTEVDPAHQKTLPDFRVLQQTLGIAVVDITALEGEGDRLFYRDARGRRIPIHRIFNRAIADEIISRGISLPVDLTRPWDVEWAGHPNWYFLISKFSVPRLSGSSAGKVVPPAVFLDEFLQGDGHARLERAGVRLPAGSGPETVYSDLLLKPLFSFAGKGIQFEPSRRELEAILPERRRDFLLQQRMHFAPTIATPAGLTQAEIRILYVWPDGGALTPVLPLVRLGRGKMMGVDHNRNQEFVGASAAYFPVHIGS